VCVCVRVCVCVCICTPAHICPCLQALKRRAQSAAAANTHGRRCRHLSAGQEQGSKSHVSLCRVLLAPQTSPPAHARRRAFGARPSGLPRCRRPWRMRCAPAWSGSSNRNLVQSQAMRTCGAHHMEVGCNECASAHAA